MKFPDCPPTLRDGVIGLTLFQILSDHKRKNESEFISLEDVQTAFKRYTGEDVNTAFDSMNMTIFDFVDQFFADFVLSCATDRRPGFKIQQSLSQKVYKKFWDIEPVEAPKKVFGLDVIPMACVASTDKTSTGTIFGLDDLVTVAGSITTTTSSASTSSSSSRVASPPAVNEPATPKIEPTAAKAKPSAPKAEPVVEKPESSAPKKESPAKESKADAKHYFGLESLLGVSSAASSTSATASKNATREPTPDQLKPNQPKESTPIPDVASKSKSPSPTEMRSSSVSSAASSANDESKKAQKKAAKAAVPPPSKPQTTAAPPQKPQATVTPMKPRPATLSNNELNSLLGSSRFPVITQEEMEELETLTEFAAVVNASKQSATVERPFSTSPLSVASERTPYVCFMLDRDGVLTNFDVASESRKQIAASVQKLPLNMTICRWVEGFLHFADVVLFLQYMNHFFTEFKEPVQTAFYHTFVKSVAEREPIFLDVVPLVGSLNIMVAWDFLRIKTGSENEADIVTMNPLVTKLAMTPLGVGMPSILFFALAGHPEGWNILELCSKIELPRDTTIDLLIDTINKRPDLYILCPPHPDAKEHVLFVDCIVKLNPRVVPLTVLYNFRLNDLSFFKELKLHNDEIDSVSQFA